MKTFYSRFKSNQQLVGVFCVLLATLGLSFKAIFIKLLYLENVNIDAVSILALRFIVAMPFFLLLLKLNTQQNKNIQEKSKLDFYGLRTFILLGIGGFYLSAILDFSALAYIPATLERLVLFLYPTFVVVICFFLRPSEVTKQIIIALIISYLGIAIVFVDQAPQMTSEMIKGVIYVLAAAIVFAVFTIASVKQIKLYGSIRFTVYAMVTATIASLTHAFLTHGFSFLIQSAEVYTIVLLMAIFSTVLPLVLMAEGINKMGAASASIVSTTGPIITISLAYVLLDEVFGFIQAIGGLMIIIGVFFVAKKSK